MLSLASEGVGFDEGHEQPGPALPVACSSRGRRPARPGPATGARTAGVESLRRAPAQPLRQPRCPVHTRRSAVARRPLRLGLFDAQAPSCRRHLRPLGTGACRDIPGRGRNPLHYDFSGFHPRYKTLPYATPDATDLARRLTGLLGRTPVHAFADRGLDHGAFIPLMAMYPAADVPVVQVSMPSLDTGALLELGARLRPLREEGVLALGSGFMTHSLAVLHRSELAADTTAFDEWAVDALARGDVDALADYRTEAPGAAVAHPTAEHFVPLLLAVGAADEPASAVSAIDHMVLGNSTDLTEGPGAVGGPFQVVVNHVRVAPEELARLTDHVADGGVSASTAGPIPEDPARGVRGASLWVRSDGAQLAELVAKVDAGKLRIHVAAHRPVAELAAVHEEAGAGLLTGKTVVLAP
ncbi:zinc-binding dehydrogenase [Streptomyces anulatus]